MMTHEETVEILATYALDAVEGAEREAIEQHLADCPRCRGELDALREVAAALGNSVEPLPEGLWSSIASRLPERQDGERPPMPRLVRGDGDDGAGAGRGRVLRPMAARGRLATLAAAAVAAAAVAVVLGVSLVHANDQVSQLQHSGTQTAVVAALEAPGHKVVNMVGARRVTLAQFVVAGGRGYLVKSKLPTLSAGQTYQLWGIIDGQPISLGLLGQSPNQASFTLEGAKSASKLGITVEPAGGSVVPSRPMVAQGTV